MNLLEKIQTSLNYPPLHKVDPNTQDIAIDLQADSSTLLAQASIPVVLAGLYKYTRNEQFAQSIIQNNYSDWLEKLFGSHKNQLLTNIANYASVSEEAAEGAVEAVVSKAIEIIREHQEAKATGEAVKNFLQRQRHDILVYLPAQLKAGDLLNDAMLDDRTNKMEGPVSNLVQGIENLFSSSENDTSVKVQNPKK